MAKTHTAMTAYLDKQAQDILTPVVARLREHFPDADITNPDESMYASGRFDAGACSVVKVKDLDLIDVRVECSSSEEYEGSMFGWGFGFHSTWEGGEVGPGGTIYNYTENVWTKDPVEIERRLAILRADAIPFAEAVAEAIKRKLGGKPYGRTRLPGVVEY